MLLIICIWWVGPALGRRRDDCNGGGSVLVRPTLLSGSARVRMYDTLVFKSILYLYSLISLLLLHSIPLMYFTESLYVVLSSRIYFEFYVYLWDIPRWVACWFYVFLCTLSEMTNKTCTMTLLWYKIDLYYMDRPPYNICSLFVSTVQVFFYQMKAHKWHLCLTLWWFNKITSQRYTQSIRIYFIPSLQWST